MYLPFILYSVCVCVPSVAPRFISDTIHLFRAFWSVSPFWNFLLKHGCIWLFPFKSHTFVSKLILSPPNLWTYSRSVNGTHPLGWVSLVIWRQGARHSDRMYKDVNLDVVTKSSHWHYAREIRLKLVPVGDPSHLVQCTSAGKMHRC